MRISVQMALNLLSMGASQFEDGNILACIAYALSIVAGKSQAQVSVGETRTKSWSRSQVHD